MTSVTNPKEAKVTPLFSKDLADFPGKEGLMITVEYPPGSSDPIHRHNAHAFASGVAQNRPVRVTSKPANGEGSGH